MQETGTCEEKKEFVCRILEKTHQLFHLIFESADSNMENIKRGKDNFLRSGNWQKFICKLHFPLRK